METKYVNEIESKEKRAREVMYRLAEERGLLPQRISINPHQTI